MERYIFPLMFLMLAMECSARRFFISAPRVFHVGVNEKVFVQMGDSYLNTPVTLHLEHESNSIVVSEKKTTVCDDTQNGRIQRVELMINREIMLRLPRPRPNDRRYLLLVAESRSFGRKITKVQVSKHRGHIFIQTDQPIYNPTQKVWYRIFTLDHTMRPHEEAFHIAIYNALGNRVMKKSKIAIGGIFRDNFPIPDVSKLGTWTIKAYYDDDEENAASREFKVQQFVLPSFEVNIAMEQSYILLEAQQFTFSILAMYSYGEEVKGAYHCQLGVIEKAKTHSRDVKPVFIRGLKLIGSVEDGAAAASFQIEDLNTHLQEQRNKTLSELQQSGAQLYLKVFVTNIQSGEMQEAEVYLPIVAHKYTMDLSRTRSHFLPGYPLDVVMFVRLPDGSPAADVPVKIDVPSVNSWQGTTNEEGAVFTVFNIPAVDKITVNVEAGGQQQRKEMSKASSPNNIFLFLSITNKLYSVNEQLKVEYKTINAPIEGNIYYMVLSRGMIVKSGSIRIGVSVTNHLDITSDMVPSFRLIGYYYNEAGDVIADSVWVDVKDECELNIKVEPKGPFVPGKQCEIEFDLYGQKAKVALLAVDKAIYALNADNKLTAKQVFSSMQSYDIGCSYSGGANPASVLTDAGLSSVSQSQSMWIRECDSQAARPRRAVDLQQEMMTLKSNFSDDHLQDCCAHGFSLIPMRRTCEERVKRVSLMEANPACAEAFLKCCLEGEILRQKKIQEDAQHGLGRTADLTDIENSLWEITDQYLRRYFPPSFEFKEFNVDGKKRYPLSLPDSITTWEIQVITLSAASGFCVVKPSQIRAFKEKFVSLRLPYSVKKYEQLSISPVIYNYGDDKVQIAVHMQQTEGLCSPGSATTTSFVNITLEPKSSQFVSFSAVPMVTGSIPIKIYLFEIENEWKIDAIEKTLNVLAEGLERRVHKTEVHELGGGSTKTIDIDASLPDERAPDSSSNIFISMEGDGFGSSHARNLLSPEKVAKLIVLPKGCVEQTMVGLAPTLAALRYLDLSEQWFDMPAGTRDDALDKIEKGFIRILEQKNRDSSYSLWWTERYSNWLTALIVKVLSLIAERQTVTFGQQGRKAKTVPEEEINLSVTYLLSQQEADGSFGDPHPVLHRGVMNDRDKNAAMTAFMNLALHRSLQFLQPQLRSDVEASIARSTSYLQSQVEELQHPYAVAITAYFLAVYRPQENDSPAWTKLQTLVTRGTNGCYLWTANADPKNQVHADAITVETTAYALLAAVELGHIDWANQTACWLTTQENYFGGFKTSQDTIMALEALTEYELKRGGSREVNVIAEFTVRGKREIVKLALENERGKVETDLKKFSGTTIEVKLTGKGTTKLKVEKAYHLLEPKSDCDQVSISVTVEGKVKYTAAILENYDYDYADETEEKEVRVPRSAIEWFDARTRNRRDLDNNLNSNEDVTYTVCVKYNLNRNLTGMSIADITLLSGFDVVTQDLDMLKKSSEQYISHYEVSHGRVLLYFNELYESKECISFGAKQKVPIGLLQPAPAVFYDYYEPNRKCTVLYSAPKRSNMVSKLCSEDVCQCAERPCHKIKNTFLSESGQGIKKNVRSQHACFFPTIDYAYMVEVLDMSMKSNFELYTTSVQEVLRSHGDFDVKEKSIRVFAQRHQCKGQLDVGKQYLLMGKDGSTKDSSGKMQYLLESNTWVERKPSVEECKKSAHKAACRWFRVFTDEYKLNGCRQ